MVSFPHSQLQILFYDSERLQQTYPGGNAEHISGQQEVVYSNWIILKDKSNLRRSNLLAQLDYYLFTQAVSFFGIIMFCFGFGCVFLRDILLAFNVLLETIHSICSRLLD